MVRPSLYTYSHLHKIHAFVPGALTNVAHTLDGHHRPAAADALARSAAPEAARLGGRHPAARGQRGGAPDPPAARPDHHRGGVGRPARRAAVLPQGVLRRRRPADPVARAVGVLRPGRGRRGHRPHLHPAGQGPGAGLLAVAADRARGLRPGRCVRAGPVRARVAQRPVLPADRLPRAVHRDRDGVPVLPAGPARGAARPAGRGPGPRAAVQAGLPGLARLLHAAQRQERHLVADRQVVHRLPGGVRGDAGRAATRWATRRPGPAPSTRSWTRRPGTPGCPP